MIQLGKNRQRFCDRRGDRFGYGFGNRGDYFGCWGRLTIGTAGEQQNQTKYNNQDFFHISTYIVFALPKGRAMVLCQVNSLAGQHGHVAI